MKTTTSSIIQIFIIISGCFAIFYVMTGMLWGSETRYVVIDSEIISIEPVEGENGIDYLFITFENNESYKIKPNTKYIDITVNSKLILELSNTYYRNWWWEDFKQDDDVYYIHRIIKIPGEK